MCEIIIHKREKHLIEIKEKRDVMKIVVLENKTEVNNKQHDVTVNSHAPKIVFNSEKISDVPKVTFIEKN